jgi:hypothetical protein
VGPIINVKLVKYKIKVVNVKKNLNIVSKLLNKKIINSYEEIESVEFLRDIIA